MAIKKAKIFAITSVKGGTGKTTITLNLASAFASMGKNVLIIDLDLYTGGIALSLNVDNSTDLYKLVYDLNNNHFKHLSDYIVPYKDNISVIPSPKDPRTANKISSKYINGVLSRASTNFDIILLDTNHFMNDINLVAFDSCDEIIYVLKNDPIDFKNMKTMVSIYQDMGKDNYKIILNESVNKLNNYFSKYDIKNVIKDKIDFVIPSSFYIKNINKYVLDGTILIENNTIKRIHKKGVKAYNLIASSLLRENKN